MPQHGDNAHCKQRALPALPPLKFPTHRLGARASENTETRTQTDTHSLPPGDGVDLRDLYRLPESNHFNHFHGIPLPGPLFLGCRRFGLTCFAGQAQQGQLLFL